MTEKASPNEQAASQDEPAMARFLQDWTELWREELQAQVREPGGMPWGMFAGMGKGGMTRDMTSALELWRSAMVAWANISGAASSASGASKTTTAGTGMPTVNPFGMTAPVADAMSGLASFLAAFREPAAAPGTEAVVAASDARDAEVERLTRRVNELEARLAELEKPRRRRR